MKICSMCKQELSLDSFTKNKNEKDGLMRQCRSCNNSRTRKHYAESRKGTEAEKQKIVRRTLRRHGITEEAFSLKLAQQGGGCAICHELKNSMVVDHDHKHCPGQWGCAECFRGVLCPECNRGLGIFLDEEARLSSAIQYLAVWRSGSALL